MIQNDNNKGRDLKAIKAEEAARKEKEVRGKCEAFLTEKFGHEQVVAWSNQYKGLWFLPILDDNDNVETMLVLQPISRHILSYASTKMEDGGLYDFLESAMIECAIKDATGKAVIGQEIIDDDELFIPAAQKLNKILEGKKAALVKR